MQTSHVSQCNAEEEDEQTSDCIPLYSVYCIMKNNLYLWQVVINKVCDGVEGG